MDHCPHCGERLPAVFDAFCPECREPLDDEPQAAVPAVVVTEPPVVTSYAVPRFLARRLAYAGVGCWVTAIAALVEQEWVVVVALLVGGVLLVIGGAAWLDRLPADD